MIREATIKDNRYINKLGQLLNPNYKKLFKLSEILKENYSKIYVYEKDKKVVGFLHATVLYETIDIINIVVDPRYRRNHIASNLFDFLLSEAPDTVCLLTLEVSEKNTIAINFYNNFGFEIINRRKGYYEDCDAYLMGRKIK